MLLFAKWYSFYYLYANIKYKHPQKKGKVTIRGHKNEVLNQFLLNSIWKQAGWKKYKKE